MKNTNGYTWTLDDGTPLLELNDDENEEGGQTAYIYERDCIDDSYLRELAAACLAAVKEAKWKHDPVA